MNYFLAIPIFPYNRDLTQYEIRAENTDEARTKVINILDCSIQWLIVLRDEKVIKTYKH